MLPTSELFHTLSVVSVRSSRSATGSVPPKPSEFNTSICTPPRAYPVEDEHVCHVPPANAPSRQ
jgi:hypothetical protein